MNDNFGTLHLALSYLLWPCLQIILNLKVIFGWACRVEWEYKKCMQIFILKPFSSVFTCRTKQERRDHIKFDHKKG